MSQIKNKRITLKNCSDLIEKQLGLDRAASAIAVVDSLTNGAWSMHINELCLKINSASYDASQVERDDVANWHYLKLKEFILIYKKGLEQDALL